MFKAEAGIPIPREYPQTKYPFRTMNVGESFLVPKEKQNSASIAASLESKRSPGKKFTRRKTDDGVRFWRIA